MSASSSLQNEPLEISGMFERGATFARKPIAEIIIRLVDGSTINYELPKPRETNSGPVNAKKVEIIMDLLSASNAPIQRKNLEKYGNKGHRGGEFGLALKWLVESGQVICRDGEYTDDINKFGE